MQRLQLVRDVGHVLEMRQRLLDVHFEHVGDALPFEAHLQRLAVEAMPFAHGAGHPHVGQKIHFQPRRAVPLARLAAPAAHVEAESPRLVAAGLRFGQFRVEIADVVEHFDVSRRIGAGRAADRRLVDGDELVEMREPFDSIVAARIADAAVEIAAEGLDENVVHQRTLSGAGHPGHTDEAPQRDFDVDTLQIIVPAPTIFKAGVANAESFGTGGGG